MGIVVLVVAVIALHDPKNPSSTQAGSGTATASSNPAGGSGTPTTASSGPTGPTSSSGSTSPESTASNAPTTAQLKAQFPLVVLNNTTTQGLASEAATRFEQGGWTVDHIGNLTNNIISTCAYYDPSVAHAKAAAKALRRQYPTIQRVEPKFDGLDDGPIVVVLTPDYSNE